MPYLTDLSLFSYGFREDGALVPLADSRLLAEASLFGAGAVLVLTSIDESGTFSSQRASHLFQDQRLQEVVLDQLLQVMLEKGYLGLDVDFEYVEERDKEAFFHFLVGPGRGFIRMAFSFTSIWRPKPTPSSLDRCMPPMITVSSVPLRTLCC